MQRQDEGKKRPQPKPGPSTKRDNRERFTRVYKLGLVRLTARLSEGIQAALTPGPVGSTIQVNPVGVQS